MVNLDKKPDVKKYITSAASSEVYRTHYDNLHTIIAVVYRTLSRQGPHQVYGDRRVPRRDPHHKTKMGLFHRTEIARHPRRKGNLPGHQGRKLPISARRRIRDVSEGVWGQRFCRQPGQKHYSTNFTEGQNCKRETALISGYLTILPTPAKRSARPRTIWNA